MQEKDKEFGPFDKIRAEVRSSEFGDKAKFIIENLNAWFGKNQALKNINMSIKQNEVTAIIGPSGCGKSTFVRCLNRLHEEIIGARCEGKVIFDGMNIYDTDVDPVLIRRRIGMVFQKPNPFPAMTVYENVVAGIILESRRKKSEIDQTVERFLRLAALWDEVKDNLNQSGARLSGGQQQRLCIARALAIEPEVILFDEPTSALDPISTAKIEELIQELKKNYTIVIVTHNMQQAARVSGYTGFFLLGELIEFDITDNIFTNPSNRLTEEYVTGRFG
ncbi:MAG: phosphate ABC transporter ATP-binding protein PstB [Nitrospirota bacterium]